MTIGINATSRHLEGLSKLAMDAPEPGNDTSHHDTKQSNVPIAAIFLPKGKTDMIYAHIPLLAQMASLGGPGAAPCLLVPLDSKFEKDLCSAVGLPRAGVVGLMEGAPGAEALLEVLRSKVEPVDVPWLREAVNAKYLGTKVIAN